MERNRAWLNLPNLLTMLRILLAPAVVAAFFTSPADAQLPALCLFLLAGLTDWLDGHIARRCGLITALGKVLDPIADKLMSAAALACLIGANVIPWYLLAVIVVKELYMGVGATICLKHRIEVQADVYGKIATALFYPAVLLAWPWHGLEGVRAAGRALICISVLLSLIAAAHYTRSSVKKWRRMRSD